MAGLVFKLEFGMAIVVNLILKFKFGMAVWIAVGVNLILEFEFCVAVVAGFMSSRYLEHNHCETSPFYAFQAPTRRRAGDETALFGATVFLRMIMLRTRARPHVLGVLKTRAA